MYPILVEVFSKAHSPFAKPAQSPVQSVGTYSGVKLSKPYAYLSSPFCGRDSKYFVFLIGFLVVFSLKTGTNIL
jgi:hypothetical protein